MTKRILIYTLIFFITIFSPITALASGDSTVISLENDSLTNGNFTPENGDTYWAKGDVNLMYIIVPVVLITLPIVILKYKGKKEEE